MIGSTIGTYRLADLLGDGGLGPVYRGVDQASGREAAFRMFTREVSSDPMLAERLRAMSVVLKKLQHANIGAVYELLTVGANLGMFMEYVPGAPLDQVRTQQAGRLEINVAVSCAVQVLRALEFSHGIGVLHHALRPSNIRVTPQGTVKVMDFGIGHAFGANRKTREDRLLTVLAYLAPEQIQNQPGDARSDIYAVGVVLYELLTGRLPFGHTTEFALRQAHLQEPVTAPRSYVPALPEWLDQAVMRALAKNPGARFQNATECRAVLEAALGLSTSKEVAVVRDVGGATVSMFEAAPPIPPAAPPAPDEPATRTSGTAPAVLAAPSPAFTPPASSDATVVIKAPPPPTSEQPAAPTVPAHDAAAVPASSEATQLAAATAPDVLPSSSPVLPPAAGKTAEPVKPVTPATSATSASQPGAAPAGRKGGGSQVLVAVAIVVLVLGAAGVGGFLWWRGQQQAPATDHAPATDQATAAPAAAAPTADLPPPSAPPADQAQAVVPPPVSSVPPPFAQAPATAQMSAPPAAGTPTSTTGASPQPRRPPVGAKPKPAEPAMPPSAVVMAPPHPPPLPPPAATPVTEAPAASKPAAHLVNLPDVSFRKVKLIAHDGAAETAVDVVLMFLEDRLTVTPATGGTTLRSVRYREISGVTYAREEKKRLGLIKSAQHQLTVDTRSAALLLRLDKDNVEAVLSAIESRTGKPVSR